MSQLSELQAKIDDIKLKISDQEYLGLMDNLKSLFFERKESDFQFAKVTLMFPVIEVGPVGVDIVMKIKSVYRMVKVNLDSIRRSQVPKPGFLEINWTDLEKMPYPTMELGVASDVFGDKLDVGGLRNVNVLPQSTFVTKIEFLQ